MDGNVIGYEDVVVAGTADNGAEMNMVMVQR